MLWSPVPLLCGSPCRVGWGGDGVGMGVGVLCSFSFAAPFFLLCLPRWLQPPQNVPPPLSSIVQPPCLGGHSSLLPIYRLICWAAVECSLCHLVVFTIFFFLININEGAHRAESCVNPLGGLWLNAHAILCFSRARRSRAARCMVCRKQDCFFKGFLCLQTVHL